MSADKKPNTEALRHGENKKSLKQGGEEEAEEHRENQIKILPLDEPR
jgi:hypothetical protein